ncbi:DNA mismatch repair protein MutS [Halalkalibacterium halodurans]|uniref:DNA mismatch repair protein MutS n=1 Tax=Halalkalibacterium halodurans TaxID=86665 RepID=UPI002AA9CE6A|nr:DNA mismatch repair protein MutS [Halalkalibacterium halodurans]MDY7222917.1 DNA mismatch repair protein MutS [Halalkalibacterium halodurans]MDY7242138.1 DNA mismatch repair protein MutS [Halalkalibacterium halodurans]
MALQTPMMKQYLEIKAQYKDAFLFFRLGDFYELFLDDAVKAAQELEITLTGRGKGEERIPMCGVPYHSADHYISRLLEKGYKIAICEQVEDPKNAKGVVKREVIKLITPGTIMDGKLIVEKENNFLCAVTRFEDQSYGIARADLTTGESRVSLVSEQDDLFHELASSSIKEVVLSPGWTEEDAHCLRQSLSVTLSEEEAEDLPKGYESLCENVEQPKLLRAFGRLLQYLLRTQKRSLEHLQPVQYDPPNEVMKIDLHSRRNLELVETLREKKKKGSLLWAVDETVTAMGGRLLKQWVERPLLSKKEIERRQGLVQSFLDHYFEREELRDELRHVYDLERLVGKVAYGNVNARELVQLRKSLQRIPAIFALVEKIGNQDVNERLQTIDCCESLVDLLEHSLVDDPPVSIKEGGMIRDGFHKELDTYRDASRNGKSWIAELEQKEREATGIKSLKIGYNKVFGYYIEVTKANIHLLEEGRYERKQTLTNAERYVTPELKEKEALILNAEESIVQLEYDLFLQVREQVKDYIRPLQALAQMISELDVIQGFATVSETHHYVRPALQEDRAIAIKGGRHPVVERVIPNGEYVANDVDMKDGRSILLITGPNMAGKSTYMRQLALIAIMGQIGCFVPADEARLPIFDQVFTRIGAADDLASGQSTFMVEMLETKYALQKATQNSLILLDEIGRGTSTYDGMALAQAIIEYIHDEIRAKTLFSTHYHELTALEKELSDVKNVHVSAVEEQGTVVFLHKVVDGQADRSYGIYVAELAGLPNVVTERAETLLAELEGEKEIVASEKEVASTNEPTQLSLFEPEPLEAYKPKGNKQPLSDEEKTVLHDLQSVDVLNTTPLEAIRLLNQWQQKLR